MRVPSSHSHLGKQESAGLASQSNLRLDTENENLLNLSATGNSLFTHPKSNLTSAIRPSALDFQEDKDI